MYHKLSFLKNPRFTPSHTEKVSSTSHQPGSSTALSAVWQPLRSQTAQLKSSCESGDAEGDRPLLTLRQAGLALLPAGGVLFSSYEPGGLYFQTVQLQNVGNVICSFRLQGPASRYFSISLPK